MTTKIVTPKSKKDVFDILDNQVKIYRTNSQVFQFQMWIREEQKYVRKSLHTTDRQHAIEKATEEFVKYRSRVQNDEKITINGDVIEYRHFVNCAGTQSDRIAQ